jgi:hypothetical protein
MLDALVAAFFLFWAVVSILVLVPKTRSAIRSRDFFGLVPEWKFFAPIPGKGDFHLLFRDLYSEATTEWTEIAIGGERRWWNFAWHPARRDRKAAFDAARDITSYFAIDLQQQLELSVPYLTFLCYVCGQPRTVTPQQTQFLLLYSEAGYLEGDPQVTFLSSTHDFSE